MQVVASAETAPQFWSEEPSKIPGRRRIRAHIGGLHCSLCTGTIEKALGRRPGVDKVAVSLTHEQALIEYDPAVARAEDLLQTLHAKYPRFQLHCFSPPEIHNIHLISGLDYVTIMQRLKDSGLNSMPGGGGEILDDEVRKRVSTKCTTEEWLDVMRAAHQVGLRTTATMMFGIGDRVEHRVRHLQRIRDLQDETGGFTAFIPWTFQRENTALGRKITEEPTGIDYLKMLAVSRLFLDNVQHIQASWLSQGGKLGQ